MPAIFLVADDSATKAAWLIRQVDKAQLGLPIHGAMTTEEAKQLIDQHTVAAAFIDFEIPSENGPAVMSYLRSKNPDALIACATSGSSQYYEGPARDAGANAFVCTSGLERDVESKIKHLLIEWQIQLKQ